MFDDKEKLLKKRTMMDT